MGITTIDMEYSHPAYITPKMFSASSTVGANGISPRFCAFTAMKIMAIIQGIVVASTAAGSQPLLYTKSGITTSTTTLTGLTSGATAPLTNRLATPVTLALGDQFWYTHGTDAAAVVAVAIEARIIPGASVTSV